MRGFINRPIIVLIILLLSLGIAYLQLGNTYSRFKKIDTESTLPNHAGIGNKKSSREANISLHEPIRFFSTSSNVIYNDEILNTTISWKLGPGDRVNVIDVKSNLLAIGTNLGIILYYSNGTRINSIYLGANVTALEIVNDNALPRILVGTSNGSAFCFTVDGQKTFSAEPGYPVIAVNYTKVYSSYEKSFVVVTRRDISVYSVNGSLILHQNIPDVVNVALVNDLDGDGLDEIIVGSDTGSVYVMYRETIFTNNFESSMLSLYASDVDGDGDKEILCGSISGIIYVLDQKSKLIAQKSVSPNAIISLLAKDFDADGLTEIATLDSSGFLTIMNYSLQVEWQYNFSSKSLEVLSARINSNSPRDLVLVTTQKIYCLEFNSSSSSYSLIWSYSSSYNITDLDRSDINYDGYDEIIFGGLSYAITLLRNDSSVFRSIMYTVHCEHILTSDLDGDDNAEIIITDDAGNLFLVNKSYYLIFNHSIGVKSREILVGDINSDSINDIVLVLENNTVLAFTNNGTRILSYSISAYINDAIIFDPDNDNALEILAGTSDGIYIINSSSELEEKLFDNSNVTSLSFGDLYSLGHDALVAGLSNGSIIIDDLPTSTLQKFNFGYGAVTDLIVDRFDSNLYKILFSTDNGYIVLMNTSGVIWELKNNARITSLEQASRNSEIIANYLQGLLLIQYNGSISLNMTLGKGILDVSYGDVVGNYSEEIIVLSDDDLLSIYRSNGNRLGVLNFSLDAPREIESYDEDHDFVNELKVATMNGILLIDSIPQIQIISPKRNTITNKSNITLKWIYQGFSPLFYEIYLYSNIVREVNSSYQEANISIPNDGSWVISLKAIPKAGESLITNLSLLVDTHEPSLKIITPSNNSYINNGTVMVEWETIDNLSGIDHSEIRIDDGDWINVGKNSSYIARNLSYGSHQIHIKAVDRAGNVNITSVLIHIDNLPPIIEFETPLNNTYLNTSTINIEWKYNEDNLDQFYLYLDGELIYKGRDTNYTASNLREGNHSITLICLDLARNSNNITIFVTIDTIAPTLEVLSPSNQTYTNKTSLRIDIQANDANLNKIVVGINESDYVDFGLNDTIEISFHEEGYYVLTIIAYDKALNSNKTNLVIVIDFSSPEISIDYPFNNTYLNESTVLVKWRGTDNVSGISGYEIIIDSGAFIDLGHNTEFRITGLRDGTHIIKIRAEDLAGNIAWVSVRVIVDTKVPGIEIMYPMNGTITNSSIVNVKIAFIEENKAFIALYLNDSFSGYIEDNSMIVRLPIEGYYIIKVEIVDLAGNSNETKIILLYDSTPPILLLPSSLNNTVLSNSSFTIRWHGVDNLSGIAHYLISIDNEGFIDVGSNEWYVVDLTDLSVGEHVVKIKAIDYAGNSIIKAIYFYKEIRIETKQGIPLSQIVIAGVILGSLAIVDVYVLIIRKKTLRAGNT